MVNPKIKFIALVFISCAGIYYLYSNLQFKSFKYSEQSLKSHSSKKYQNLQFDINGNDVFSFVHIQKTGGTTMEKHLVSNIKDGNCECQKTKKPSCMCYRGDNTEIWLICRYIQPKWPCGLHPDYASLKECSPTFIDNKYGEKERRYFYGTLIRDPVVRFLSEFRHRQRGANWENSAVLCKGKQFMDKNPRCYEGKIWLNLTLEDFLSCPYNLAINRQTWMLSNISKVICDFKTLMTVSKHQEKLLAIAKRNIRNIAYFGLLEYPQHSQFIFEKTFNLEFNEPFTLWNTGFAKVYLEGVSDEMIQRVKEVNMLDVQLYKYAKVIFFERYTYFVTKYGKPIYKVVSPTSRFNFKDAKKRRLIDNLPKSEAKRKVLKKKIEEEEERQQQVISKWKNIKNDKELSDII